MTRPSWLPAMISTNGEPKEVFQRLYDVFYRDFHVNRCYFAGRSVGWDRRILPGETYEEGFWHLITEMNDQENDRLFDPRRSERLPWCRPTIVNNADPAVRVWDYQQGKHLRTYVWLYQEDYLVVLEKKRRFVFLITAYHIDGNQTRKKLQRRYDESQR